jgi:hypothetical protein
MDWFPTVSDCIEGPVLVYGKWIPREESSFPNYYCGCGCGIWLEECFFCKKLTLSSNAVLADKGNGKFRFSCSGCSIGRDIEELS